MSAPVLLVVVAATRPGRIGIHFARWFTERAEAHGGFEVRLADLQEIALPALDEPKHPRLGDYEHEHTKSWSAIVGAADAVVFVTPEYNHSFPGALKNAIDFLHGEWADKPAGFVSYGGVSAGTRAVAALKAVLGSLRMVPVVEAVNIPFAPSLVQPDGTVAANDVTEGAATAMLDELVRLTAALRRS